jgi:hypothetical protein
MKKKRMILRYHSFFCTIFAPEITKNRKTMSKESLEHLRDYIQLTLSPSDISWLADELLLISQKEQQLEPYTIEELEERVMASERQIAEGRFQDFDEALDELEAEFAEEDKRMTETV